MSIILSAVADILAVTFGDRLYLLSLFGLISPRRTFNAARSMYRGLTPSCLGDHAPGEEGIGTSP